MGRHSASLSAVRPYEHWPEWIRWLLFFPGLVLVPFMFGLILLALSIIRRDEGLLAVLGISAASAWMFFPLLWSLAPRAKRLFMWFFYLAITGYCALAALLGGARALGLAGLLPMLPPPEGDSWSEADTIGVVRSLVWIVVGTIAFRRQLRLNGVSTAHPV